MTSLGAPLVTYNYRNLRILEIRERLFFGRMPVITYLLKYHTVEDKVSRWITGSKRKLLFSPDFEFELELYETT